MDELVKAALKKWPNVPACHGWLGLDGRGQWWMRDDRAQHCGDFDSGAAGAKGSHLRHDKLIDFIGRNYECETAGPLRGAWFFQNGPQKVYVELLSTPLIMRVNTYNGTLSVTDHTGHPATVRACLIDEDGHLYLAAERGLGLVHSQDMLQAADAIESGHWHPETVLSTDLPKRFGYVKSPQRLAR